jgi:hypothetical protein
MPQQADKYEPAWVFAICDDSQLFINAANAVLV